MDAQPSGTDEIRQYLALLHRWLWLIVLGTVLAGASAFIASRLSTPIYEAATTLLISEGQQPSGPDYSAILLSERLAKTYAEMLQGQPVLNAVEIHLGVSLEEANVTVEPVRDTQLIRLKVQHPDPALAAAIANALPEAFIQQNEQPQAARFQSSLESLSGEMQRIQSEIDAAQLELEAARARPDAAGDGQIARLETLLAQYRATYAGLLQSYEEVRIAQARATDSLTVFEPATVPRSPALPRTRTNTLLAAVVGAMLAVGAAFLIEYLDDTIKQPDQLERAVGLPTFASILRIPDADNGQGPVMATEPDSPIAEAYRMLRTNLEFSTLGMGPSAITLLVTSAEPQDGKTTTLANLGLALAQGGKRVLLVDTDLRRPALHQPFHLPNERGLTSLLLNPQADPSTVIQATGVDRLQVLAAGPLPSNPAEVLDFPQTAHILGHLRSLADYVILDSPPVLSVADASILAQKVDGVVFIVEAGQTRTDMLRRAVAALRAVNAHLLGAVLNNVAAGPGHPYYHYYYYGRRDGSQKRRQASRSAGAPGAVAHRQADADRSVYTARARLEERRARLNRQKTRAFWTLLLLTSLALLLFAAAALYETLDQGFLSPAGAASGYDAEEPLTPAAVGTTPSPTLTPLPTASVATATRPTPVPAQPTAPPTPLPTRFPPTSTPTTPPTPTPTSSAGLHGVAARLRLRDPQAEYAVGQPVFFTLEIENHTANPISLGIVGLKAGDLPFQSSWSQLIVQPYATVTGEDHLVFQTPGTYPLIEALCFSAYDACPREGADWEEFPTGVLVTVR